MSDMKRVFLKSYFSRREAEAFVDGVVAAGWISAEVEVVAEQGDNPWSKTQFVVYHRVAPAPAPVVTPRRRFVR
jgi:hypothetical protein